MIATPDADFSQFLLSSQKFILSQALRAFPLRCLFHFSRDHHLCGFSVHRGILETSLKP